MSVDLVSLAQAQDHLRDYYSENEGHIELLITAASRACLKYLDGGEDSFADSDGQIAQDSNGTPIGVPEDIQGACLLMLGYLYRDREPDLTADSFFAVSTGYGYLPRAVMSLLFPYRSPVVG